MESQVSQLINIALSKKKYHFYFLSLCFVMWCSSRIFDMGILGMSRPKLVNYDNKAIHLNLTLCKFNNYTENKTYPYSIISYFKQDCVYSSKIITWSPYIGSLIGGIAFGFLNQRFTHKNIIFLNVIFYMLFILTSTFGDSFASTSVFIFLSSINASIVILSTYIQGIEMASHTQRAIFGSIVFSGEIACNCLNVIVFMFII